eukprot:TRINITY_DN8416_c0_g1_i1.p1 TRINITY_DN8416_c0_g1~~TRINITY_DN8416_c0_g1_i1.p1  ORF type:complete len:1171 (+),score=309.98 TRINITY_DN8416_c0_g1_i1:211-3723(+)
MIEIPCSPSISQLGEREKRRRGEEEESIQVFVEGERRKGINSIVENKNGEFILDGKLGWISERNGLLIYEFPSAKRIARFSFEEKKTIVHVQEASLFNNNSLLIVSLSCLHSKGELHFINLSQLKTIKIIHLPFQPSKSFFLNRNSKRSEEEGEDRMVNEHNAPSIEDSSILFVGSRGGNLYSIFLSLNDFKDDSKAKLLIKEWNGRTEEGNEMELMEGFDFVGYSIGLKQEEDGESVKYKWIEPSSRKEMSKQVLKKNVWVTCLKVIKSIHSLAVGNNLGGFQLISLSTFQVLYSSPLSWTEGSNIGKTDIGGQVIDFCDQKLDNDRYLCLWVGRGNRYSPFEEFSNQIEEKIVLFHLDLQRWKQLQIQPSLNLDVCVRKLEHSPPISKSGYWKLAHSHSFPDDLKSELDESEAGKRIAVFGWKLMNSSPQQQQITRFEVYDAQNIAEDLSWNEHPSSSYPPFISYHRSESPLISCYFEREMMELSENEENFPRQENQSLDHFKLNCLFEDFLVIQTMNGRQLEVLNDLALIEQPLSNETISQIYNKFVAVGLIPRKYQSNLNEDNLCAVLQVCLKNNLVSWICCCVENLSQFDSVDQHTQLFDDSESSIQHQTIAGVILKWARMTLRESSESVHEYLESTSLKILGKMDHDSLLENNFVRVSDLRFVFAQLAKIPSTEKGQEEVNKNVEETELLVQHLETIMWFQSARLLERLSDSKGEFLLRWKKGKGKKMIDILISYIGFDTFNQVLSAGNTLEMFSFGSPSHMVMKLNILFYILLGLEKQYPDQDMKKKIEQFASYFMLSVSTQKFIRGIWLLDNIFENNTEIELACHYLNDPTLCLEDIAFDEETKSSLISAILRSLWNFSQFNNSFNSIIQFYRGRSPAITSVDDYRIVLEMFVRENTLQEAFQFQRSFKGVYGDDKKAFEEFIELVLVKSKEKQSSLLPLVQLPFDIEEENTFVERLREEKENNLLAVYLLQRGRFSDLATHSSLMSKTISDSIQSVFLHSQLETIPTVDQSAQKPFAPSLVAPSPLQLERHQKKSFFSFEGDLFNSDKVQKSTTPPENRISKLRLPKSSLRNDSTPKSTNKSVNFQGPNITPPKTNDLTFQSTPVSFQGGRKSIRLQQKADPLHFSSPLKKLAAPQPGSFQPFSPPRQSRKSTSETHNRNE